MTDLLPTFLELQAFTPEILLVATTAGVLALPMLLKKQNLLAVPIAATAGLGAAWLALFLVWKTALWSPASYFGGMLVLDPFAWTIKLLLIGFTLVVMALWFTDSHDKFITRGQTEDTPEFFAMLLAATLGLCLLAGTTHLLMMFVALEMASLPSYVLAGFRKGHRPGAQGGMKFLLLGAAATALMLYGMSLLYGLFGTLDLREMGALLLEKSWQTSLGGTYGVVFGLGLLGLVAGLAFKIAMVPAHFWCPDVFEGASIDVTTFLAVGSATAGLAALMRVMLTLTGPYGATGHLWWLAAGLLLLGTLTCFCGNLGAYWQTNIKRLLAWSSIAHAGYMVIGMSALVLPARREMETPSGALLDSPAADTLLFYLLMYLFMNGGAFIAAAAIAQRLTGPKDAGMSLGVDKVISSTPAPPQPTNESGEDIAQYAGLWRRAPILAATMLVFILSLAGVPLTIGFAAKLKLLSVLFDMGSPLGWIGISVIALNCILGAFSYFRVIRQMYLTESDAPRLIEIAPVTIVALVLVVPNILLFLGYGLLEEPTRRHAEMLAPPPSLIEHPVARAVNLAEP